MKSSQIIAVGGRLLTNTDNTVLEKYILAATGVDKPRVCFIPTATGDHPSVIARFYEVYSQLHCSMKHLPLFARTPADLEEYLLACDVIHAGGGNTRSMLAVWEHWGIHRILRTAFERGIVLTGSSAGMICWFEQGVTDSIAGPLTVTHGLGLLAGSACPHYDGEIDRRPAYHALRAANAVADGYAADDGAGLHFVDGKLAKVVSVSTNARAYRITGSAGGVHEETLDGIQL